jgi:hypothetical protein
MTKQRPKASTLRVGTRSQGYVVKTRRAGLSKRIKYWAKQVRNKPKRINQAKATKARPTKRKLTRRKATLTKSGKKSKVHKKLRGGAMDVEQVLDELADENSDLMKHYTHMCKADTMVQIRHIGHVVKTRKPKKGVQYCVEFITGTFENMTSDNAAATNAGPMLTAFAIVAAKVKLAMHASDDNGRAIRVKDMYNYQKNLTVHLADNVWASIQSEWPEFVVNILNEGFACSRDSTFKDFKEDLFTVLYLQKQ